MSHITKTQFENFEKFISNHDAFIIAGHKEPDGDCIASSIALSDLLKKLDKKVLVVNSGPFKRPEIKVYKKYFTTELKQLTSDKKKTGLFIVDCSEIERLGDISTQLSMFDSFIIDHHRTGKGNPDSSIIDSTAPAAAYLVQQIFEHECGTIPEETAKILFFGLCTDTGFFRFLDTKSADVFKAAARLIEAGANPRETYDYITNGKPFNTRKLLGIMLNRAEPFYEGKLIITYETMADTQKYAKEGRDSDILYQALLAIEGVEAVVFMRQESITNCTVGLRSRNEVDVSAVASKFGGGGHKNASGLSTEAQLESLKSKIIKEFARFFT